MCRAVTAVMLLPLLMAWECPVPLSPAINCTCQNFNQGVVNCQVLQSLPQWPGFQFYNRSLLQLILYASSEVTITTFQAGAFRDIATRDLLINNNIRVTTMKPGAFQTKNSDLKLLELKAAGLVDIPVNAFSGASSLTEIDLSSNSISVLRNGAFLNLPNLSKLTVSFAKISTIEQYAFSGLTSLKYLIVNGNMLSVVNGAFSNLPSLISLSLDANTAATGAQLVFTPDALTNLPNLQILGLSYCDLTQVPVLPSLPSLKYLTYEGNNLAAIQDDAFMNVAGLERLLLGVNSLTAIPVTALRSLPNLMVLDLNRNQITSIGNCSFSSNSLLKTLELKYNPLHTISRDAFGSLYRLEVLDLSFLTSTVLQTLDHRTFMCLTALNRILLYGSKFTCDCQLAWLRQLNLQRSVYVLADDKACSNYGPPQSSYQNILQFPVDSNDCDLAGIQLDYACYGREVYDDDGMRTSLLAPQPTCDAAAVANAITSSYFLLKQLMAFLAMYFPLPNF